MANSNAAKWAEVDQDGRLVIPAEIVDRYGLSPGARVRIEEGLNDIRLHRPVTHLTKIYLEATDQCNLTCRMCMRQSWDETLGQMSRETFSHILASLRSLSPVPKVFFGGFGEPLFHPCTIQMIAEFKSLGAQVEMITNGTLLDLQRSRQIIEAGLDCLWVSIDGATPESYTDVRLGAALPEVLENLSQLRGMRRGGHFPKPEIGIAFVAMRRNIHELSDVLKLGRQIGAKRFMVTNLLPHLPEMQTETLYTSTLRNIAYLPSPWLPHLNFPKMDLDERAGKAFVQALNSGCNLTFAGSNLGGANDVCTFIETGSMAIAWDGSVSPCPPLLHNHVSFLHGRERKNRRHVIGNVSETDLLDLWRDPDYVAYRQRVQSFAFAPCTTCGGCDLSEANEADCYGNTFPSCGGCLWAQGVIQCP
jgi:MoaA/NifB/PqqE/SkfB family radical SAM enzyme